MIWNQGLAYPCVLAARQWARTVWESLPKATGGNYLTRNIHQPGRASSIASGPPSGRPGFGRLANLPPTVGQNSNLVMTQSIEV